MSVINLYSAPDAWAADSSFVYIGRSGKGFKGGFGNPFILNNESERAEVLVKYTHWLVSKVLDDPSYAFEVKQLANKTLVCFCAPKPCHGDILQSVAILLNELT